MPTTCDLRVSNINNWCASVCVRFVCVYSTRITFHKQAKQYELFGRAAQRVRSDAESNSLVDTVDELSSPNATQKNGKVLQYTWKYIQLFKGHIKLQHVPNPHANLLTMKIPFTSETLIYFQFIKTEVFMHRKYRDHQNMFSRHPLCACVMLTLQF